jgi:hypothetical protein
MVDDMSYRTECETRGKRHPNQYLKAYKLHTIMVICVNEYILQFYTEVIKFRFNYQTYQYTDQD